MVRPLTKCNKQGNPYQRLPAIDASIAQALQDSLTTFVSRSAVTDRDDPQYLDTEVLVHLIRNALTANDTAASTALVGCLGIRCLRILRHRVRPNRLFNATDVHEETISRLYEQFADDQANPALGTLDFYEIRFNQAFAALRTSVIREELSRHAPGGRPLEPLPDRESDAEPDAIEWDALDRAESDPERSAESAEFWRMVQSLPLDEREAIMGKYLFGHKVESTDPEELTVATLCEVSGSEIRSRLRSAVAQLKWMKEQKS
jgi:DNA-directed RNA polymerase specialized sigma24 family protein